MNGRKRGGVSPSLFFTVSGFRTLCFLLIGICPAVLASCGGGGSSAPPPPKTWNILVYMDGDNNLGPAALKDLQEMKSAPGSPYVTIVVQLDLDNNVPTRRYRVANDNLVLLEDLGERDMASPDTLTGFLAWADNTLPAADRTVLILWNHGNGWDQGDAPTPPLATARPRSVFYDDDNHSPFLSNQRAAQAIRNAGIRLDLLGMDASIMGTLEAMYEFRDLAPVLVTSQEVGFTSGWDYKAILTALSANPGMDAEELGRVVVDAYRNSMETFYLRAPGYERKHTISAVRAGFLDNVATEVDRLGVDLTAAMDNLSTRLETVTAIGSARAAAQAIDLYVTPYVYVDLVDLDRLLDRGTGISGLVSGATIAEYHGSARPDAHGVSIVFFQLPEAAPPPLGLGTFDNNYRNYDNVANTGNAGAFINRYRWDEFLHRYYALQ